MALNNHSQAITKLFPHFKEDCVILAAKLKNSSEFDPEDERAAKAIYDCIENNGGKPEIKSVSSIGEIGNVKHIIALGGWVPLNQDSLSSGNLPFDLYFYTDYTMDDKTVIRKFKLDPEGKKEKRMRAIMDKNLLPPHNKLEAITDDERWLIKDYLLITTIRLKSVMPSADESLFYTLIAGLYGTGTMAVELFLRDFESKFKEPIKKKLKGNPCFQLLFPVYGINHEGDYSYAQDIDIIKIYPIAESSECFMQKDGENKGRRGLSADSKKVKEINIFPERSKEQIEIYPSFSCEKFKKLIATKKLLSSLIKFILENYAQHKRIHWLYGFIIFSSWRKGTTRGVDDPADTFNDYISLLNSFGDEEGFWRIERNIEENNEAARHEKRYYEFKNRGFCSNIIAAYDIYEEAQRSDDCLERKNKLSTAWQKYPNLIEINKSLVDCWTRDGFEGVGDDDIKKMAKIFGDQARNYNLAYKAIVQKQKGNTSNGNDSKLFYWDLPSVKEVIRDLLKTLGEVKEYANVLERRIDKEGILSNDEVRYGQIKDLIFLIQGNELDEEADQSFHLLAKEDVILEIKNAAKRKIRNKHFSEFNSFKKDLENSEDRVLWEIITKPKIDFNQPATLDDLKNRLIAAMYHEFEELVEKKF